MAQTIEWVPCNMITYIYLFIFDPTGWDNYANAFMNQEKP